MIEAPISWNGYPKHARWRDRKYTGCAPCVRSKRIGNVAKVTHANFILGCRLLASAHLVCLGLSVRWSCRWATPSTFAGAKCHTSAHICAPSSVHLRSTPFLPRSGFMCFAVHTVFLTLVECRCAFAFVSSSLQHTFRLPSHWSSQLTPSWRTLIKVKDSASDGSHDLLDLCRATGEVRWEDANVLILLSARTCVRSGCWIVELPITEKSLNYRDIYTLSKKLLKPAWPLWRRKRCSLTICWQIQLFCEAAPEHHGRTWITEEAVVQTAVQHPQGL